VGTNREDVFLLTKEKYGVELEHGRKIMATCFLQIGAQMWCQMSKDSHTFMSRWG